MNGDSIISIIYEERMDDEIARKVLTDSLYKEAEQYSAKKMKKLMKAGLTEK